MIPYPNKAPQWVPLVLALVVAGATAYTVAVNPDRRISTMVKLHSAWSQIATEYDRLWNHASNEDSESQLEKIMEQEKEPSVWAIADALNDRKLLGKWQDRVFSLYHLTSQRG